MLGKLMEVPQMRPLIPFVRSTYAHPTSHEWEDQHGTRHQVWQHEGGEQGDPLMPLLLCLAVHNALADIQEQLRPGEHVFAFLDDIYLVSLPERLAPSSIWPLRSWVLGPASSCTRARLECGTRRASVLPIWSNLEMKFGTQPESKSSGPLWERRNSQTSCGKPLDPRIAMCVAGACPVCRPPMPPQDLASVSRSCVRTRAR